MRLDLVVEELERQVGELTLKVGEQQARIDRLMLEFWPDEMTPEKIEEWGRNQKVVSDERKRELQEVMRRWLGGEQ